MAAERYLGYGAARRAVLSGPVRLVTLVIAATVITFGYQALHHVLSRRVLILAVISAMAIAAGALLLVLMGLRP